MDDIHVDTYTFGDGLLFVKDTSDVKHAQKTRRFCRTNKCVWQEKPQKRTLDTKLIFRHILLRLILLPTAEEADLIFFKTKMQHTTIVV